MAIREIIRKNRVVHQVYWNDPESGRRRSKIFYDMKDAKSFDRKCLTALDDYRRKYKTRYKHNSAHRPAFPTKPNGFDELKERCQNLYSDNHIRIADIFDLVMESIDLPVRFKDISATIRNREKGKSIPAKLRAKVLMRDGCRCKMCGASAMDTKLHVDHIIPVSRGGITEERNLQTLCRTCNLGKSDLPL